MYGWGDFSFGAMKVIGLRVDLGWRDSWVYRELPRWKRCPLSLWATSRKGHSPLYPGPPFLIVQIPPFRSFHFSRIFHSMQNFSIYNSIGGEFQTIFAIKTFEWIASGIVNGSSCLPEEQKETTMIVWRASGKWKKNRTHLHFLGKFLFVHFVDGRKSLHFPVKMENQWNLRMFDWKNAQKRWIWKKLKPKKQLKQTECSECLLEIMLLGSFDGNTCFVRDPISWSEFWELSRLGILWLRGSAWATCDSVDQLELAGWGRGSDDGRGLEAVIDHLVQQWKWNSSGGNRGPTHPKMSQIDRLIYRRSKMSKLSDDFRTKWHHQIWYCPQLMRSKLEA